MAEKVTAAERTRQAITAINSGDIAGGRQLLAEALSTDADYELAWLWFAAVADSDEEKKFCLERARDVNPLHEANAALGPLRGVKQQPPPELTSLVDPEPPEFVQDYVPELVRQRRRRKLRFGAIALAVLAVLGLVFWAANNRAKSPVYLAVVVSDDQGDKATSREIMDTVNWAVDEWNSSGKVGTHPLAVQYFSDNDDPATAAEVAKQIAADDRFVGVVGHQLSSTSQAAGPIYAQAGIPVITATATADAVTKGNPWYFRTVFDNATQGEGIAAYVSQVLKAPASIVVYDDSAYGITLRDGYVSAMKRAGDQIQAQVEIPAGDVKDQATIDRIVTSVTVVDKPGPIVLMVDDPAISALGPALEAVGVAPTLVGSDSLALRDFFAPLAEGKAGTVNRALAASPLTRGALTGEAVRFVHDFSEYYGYQPSWASPLTYDAVNAFAESIAGIDTGAGVAAQRTAIRDRFDHARSPETSLDGLTGDIYFDDSDSAERPVGMESGRIAPNGELTIESAPIQLAPYSPSAGASENEEIAAGEAVRFLDTVYTLQQIVAVGINYNQVDELDVASQTYFADFFIWFKYAEDKDDPADVVFTNAVDSSLGLGEPQRLQTVAGQTYALYRVAGEFKGQFNFRQFPFDRQELPILLQHRSLPAARLSYFPDEDLLLQTQSQRLESGVDAGSTIDAIPNWEAYYVNFFPSSVGNTSALGDPYFIAGTSGVTYSVFASNVEIRRDVSSFLVKNLLPLILLSIVVYISLWLPLKDHTSRISMAVTGILTGAVMLNTVTSSLPDVDYTVAIEWAYYVFIALAAATAIVTLIGRQWNDERRLASVRALNRFARIAYPLVILAVAFVYWYQFHDVSPL